MKILLDIDDTSLVLNKKTNEYEEHPRLKELINKFDVYLYSGNNCIEDYYDEWKTKGYISKSLNYCPEADILIDDMADEWKQSCQVKKTFKSIDSFFRYYEARVNKSNSQKQS